VEVLFLKEVGWSASLATSTTSSSLYKFTPINSHHTSTMAPRKAAKKGNVARSAAATAVAKFNSKCANTPAVAADVAAPADSAATAAAAAAAPTSKSKRKCTKSADAAVAMEAAANVAATASPASAAAATAVAAAASSARKKRKGTKTPAVAAATASAASAKSPITATTAATPLLQLLRPMPEPSLLPPANTSLCAPKGQQRRMKWIGEAGTFFWICMIFSIQFEGY
jgi:hypothetical protein